MKYSPCLYADVLSSCAFVPGVIITWQLYNILHTLHQQLNLYWSLVFYVGVVPHATLSHWSTYTQKVRGKCFPNMIYLTVRMFAHMFLSAFIASDNKLLGIYYLMLLRGMAL